MMVAFAYSQTIIYHHYKKVFELFGKSLNPYLETVSILVWKLYRQVQKPSGADKEAINHKQLHLWSPHRWLDLTHLTSEATCS